MKITKEEEQDTQEQEGAERKRVGAVDGRNDEKREEGVRSMEKQEITDNCCTDETQ